MLLCSRPSLLKPSTGCDEAMVVTNSYYTKSAKELSSTAGVRLIDRDGLQSYLDDYNQKLIEVFQAEEESA
jgi:restriction system protein